jgi:hypothetical protein
MKSAAPGYSGRPLFKKLGIQPGSRVKTGNAPSDYLALLAPIPDGARISSRLRAPVDIWHLFVTSRSKLEAQLGRCQSEITQSGMVWVSWPKKASGVRSDVTEDVVREVALPLGFVDVKVCAVDEVWSGLKLVIRRSNRKSPAPP